MAESLGKDLLLSIQQTAHGRPSRMGQHRAPRVLGSATLDDLQRNFSARQPPATPMTEPMQNDVFAKVQVEIHHDPLKQATHAVITEMAKELQKEISALPK